MNEPVFFNRGAGLTLEEIACIAGAKAPNGVEAYRRIFDISSIERAGPGDLVYADRSDQAVSLHSSQAGVCLTSVDLAGSLPKQMTTLLVGNPYDAFISVAAALYPGALRQSSLYEVQGHARTALVHPLARLEAGVTIDPAAIIGPRAEIGGGTLIGPMTVVGPGVRIGRNCVVGAGVSIANALIGDRVVIHAGCRIGEPGLRPGPHRQAPDIGRVILQDGVEIGSNSAVDRGGFGDTVIGENTTIANLMTIPGDVMIGRQCAIVAITDGQAAPASLGAHSVLWFADGGQIAAPALAAGKLARVSRSGGNAQ